MQQVMNIGKGLADGARLRALMALGQGELCLCELIALLKLAPSTVSRHMAVLVDAGLVTRRKEGRWQYFRLADRHADSTARAALRWVGRALDDDPAIAKDRKALRKVGATQRAELCACYR